MSETSPCWGVAHHRSTCAPTARTDERNLFMLGCGSSPISALTRFATLFTPNRQRRASNTRVPALNLHFLMAQQRTVRLPTSVTFLADEVDDAPTIVRFRQLRGTSAHGRSRSTRMSPGSPSTRSPRMFFITSVVPPSIELARLRRNAFCSVSEPIAVSGRIIS